MAMTLLFGPGLARNHDTYIADAAQFRMAKFVETFRKFQPSRS
ncbi:hypothetical protein [Paraburkholderia sp. UYCP14C]|nr:hypothetical protein [Paraburkholderia sp. UYCP14C]